MSIREILDHYQHFRPFTDAEAWAMFKLAAISEAIGWTLLIIGVACTHLPVSWNQIPVQLAGRTHGTLFLIYIVAVLVFSPSLGWSLLRTGIAGLCSVPPYGSLIYELWSAQQRNHVDFMRLRVIIGYNLVAARQLA